MSERASDLPASAAAVAGLARQVEALRHQLKPLDGLSGRVTDLADIVASLADEVAARAGATGELTAPSWLALPATHRGEQTPADQNTSDDSAAEDPAEGSDGGGDVLGVSVALLDDVVDWLGSVFLRYPDAASALPECWLWHPALIEELVWLMVAWRAAYLGEGATVRGAGDWHDRYRPGVVRRIKTGFGSCSLAEHTEPAPVVGAPFAESAQQIATWWTDRDTTAEPVPTGEQLERAAARWRQHRGGRR